MQWFIEHPSEAFRQVAAHAAQHPAAYRTGALREALEALSEHETFHDTYPEHASSDPGRDEAPAALAPAALAPSAQQTSGSGPGTRQAEVPRTTAPGPRKQPQQPQQPSPTTYAGLVQKPSLTPAEWDRLQSLAAARHPQDDDAGGLLPDTYFEKEPETHE